MWLRELRRQQLGRTTDPGTWDGADQDQNWIELRAERDKFLGRR
jgi:hypothetical protein